MPLKRTPPNTPTEDRTSVSETACVGLKPRTIPQSGSTPNLTSLECENISSRLKRKREDDFSSVLDEFRSLLSANTAKADNKFAEMQAAMREIIAQNTEIKESIAYTSKQHDDVIIKLETLESERKVDRRRIQELEERVENLERLHFSTRIEIRNVPKKQGESKEDLCRLITEASTVFNSTIQRHEIKDIFRSGKKDGGSLITVDFVSVATKESIIRQSRQYNIKNRQNKLNTTHFKVEGPAKPVYIAERLTSKTQRTYYLARSFAKENNYRYCWTSHGRVFLRQDDGKQHFLINSEADLNSLLE